MLILDNSDDPDLDISLYFPVGDRGTILITTRNPDCKIYATAGSYELGQMETEDAITLILKTTGTQNLSDKPTREIAKSVVLTLGCLALAIDQAGAVIRKGLCSMEEYCEIYSRHRKELLSQKAAQGRGDYEYTVYTTWEISLRMIEEKGGEAARDAIELLQIFSFLHHDGISEEIFHRAWENLQKDMHSGWMRSHQTSLLRQESATWDSRRIRNAVSILSSFTLISRDTYRLVSIHPLVHAWARDRLSHSDEERIWTLTICMMSMSISWTFQTVDYRFRRLLVPHIDACLRIYPDGVFHLRDVGQDCLNMAEKFGLVYQENGRRQEALQLTETVVEARKRTLGEEHPDTLGSMHALALIYSEVGRRQEALQLTETIVAARKRTLGEEHPDTLSSMHALALRYSEVGRWQEAPQLTETVVAARKMTLGEEHPDTLSSMHALTIRYSEVGRRQEALQLTETVVAVRKRTLGEEHPGTLASMHNLANRYSEAGRRREALQLAETVAAARKRTLGEEHPHTLSSMHALANRYGEAGRRQEALQLMEMVVAVHKRTLDEEHPDILLSMHNLASRYNEVGRWQEALRLTETVVAARKRTLGEEHPDTLSSMHNLASRYNEVGRRQEALQLTETVVAVLKRTLGEEHPDTLGSMHNLAIIYSEVGRLQEALQLTETVLEMRKRTLGE
jgi:tetratricopeptide (TPR) repeat protein